MSVERILAYGFVGQILGSVFYGERNECNFPLRSCGLMNQTQEYMFAYSS